MTTKRILYTRPDGGLSVLIPAPASQVPGESEAAWVARVADKDVPQGTSYRIVDTATDPLPSRRWRDAWTDPGAGAVAVDLPRARGLRKAELLAAHPTLDAELVEQAVAGAADLARLDALSAADVSPGRADTAAFRTGSLRWEAEQVGFAPVPVAGIKVGKVASVRWAVHGAAGSDAGAGKIRPGEILALYATAADLLWLECSDRGRLAVRRMSGSNHWTVALDLFAL